MAYLLAATGLAIILFVLWDAFETILLPRRINSHWRISHFALHVLWSLWVAPVPMLRRRNAREDLLAVYALLGLVGLLVIWASGLVVGFAVLYRAAGSPMISVAGPVNFRSDLYVSGTTFFTLGLGDVAPTSPIGRLLVVIEAGTGMGFLAMVLSYIPVLYQAFSRRETRITLLDAWAGSPPTAAVLLRRCFESRDPAGALAMQLREWEIISAEILESHMSYPILAYFRSQHDNQSWLAAVTAVLDTCALVIAGVDGIDPFQARLTFAISRHMLVDLSQVLARRPVEGPEGRRRDVGLAELRTWLAGAGVRIAEGPEAERRLDEMRALYEPYLEALAARLLMPLPPWLPPERARFNWETTAWARTGRLDAH